MLTLMVATMLPLALYAQKVSYSYDASGNRILRTLASEPSQAPRLSETLPDLADNMLQISVSPNPTNGLIYIRFSHWNDMNECNLLLSNISGQIITKQSITSVETVIDISSRQNGYYILSLELNGKLSTYKIIKN